MYVSPTNDVSPRCRDSEKHCVLDLSKEDCVVWGMVSVSRSCSSAAGQCNISSLVPLHATAGSPPEAVTLDNSTLVRLIYIQCVPRPFRCDFLDNKILIMFFGLVLV